MIIGLTEDAPGSTAMAILAAAAEQGLSAHQLPDGRGGHIVGVEGSLPPEVLALPGVSRVQERHHPYMLASGEGRDPSRVRIGPVRIGAGMPVIIAGPCVVESREQVIETARAVKAAGAVMLRGGAFKPRTSPYSFQGMGEIALRHLAEARETTGLPVVTEVMETEQVELVAEYADMLQVGARNMANFPLLRRVGKAGKPVLLKRGFSATVEEWLLSAEYILASGNPDVVLCERGVRGFDPMLRFSLDLNAVPLAKELTHLPVIVDPSHGTGRRSLVRRMALAGLAAGADGVIIEVHPNPDSALCDGAQSITPAELQRICDDGLALHAALAQDEDDDIIAATVVPLSA